MTYRVEITRDQSRPDGDTIEITGYIDRVPETNEAGFGRLTRAAAGVWNSRLFYSGDFETLGAALEAIEAAYPRAARIDCYEWPVDYEDKIAVPPLLRADSGWQPGSPSASGAAAPLLDWRAA